MRLALCLLFSLSVAAKPPELPRPNQTWTTLKADEFTFVSNASDSVTTNVASQLLRMRAAVGEITHLRVRSTTPMTVFVFANERSFAPFRDATFGPNSENITGIFLSNEGGNFILLRGDAASGVDRVVFHELTHYFVRNTLTALPMWLNEGIAEYYSTFDADGGDVSVGRPIADHVRWLQGQPMIPLQDLFGVDRNSALYNESSHRGAFYAESWAMVHYLMLGKPERRAQFSEFLRLMTQMPFDDAYTRAFGDVTYAKLERELRLYVTQKAFSFTKFSLNDVDVTDIDAPVELTRDELLYSLGHLLAYAADNPSDAKPFLAEALKINPSHAGSYADMGRLYDDAGDKAQADAAFGKAVQLGSNDARIYVQYGRRILEKEPLKARDAFRKAAQLDPNLASAWTGLGETYVVTGSFDKDEGIAALEKSLALVPGDIATAFDLAQLYAISGRRAEAAKLVDGVLARSGDARMRDQAQEVLLLADAREVDRLLQSNQVEEGTALARTILAKTKNQALIAQLNAVIAQADEFTVMRAAVQALNDAISKANAGKYAEALDIVDRVLPVITDAEVEKQARTFRDEVTKRMGRKK